MNNILLWAMDKKMWWGPDRAGYTTDCESAGRYDYETATLVAVASNYGPLDEATIPVHEDMGPYWQARNG